MKKFLVRAFCGLLAIYGINQFFAEQGILLQVGLNEITFLTSGTLGFPGVALLYGIMALKFL